MWALWQTMSSSKPVCMSDYDSQLLITGYIRCIISCSNIPSDIVNFILLTYLEVVDQWDLLNTNNWLNTISDTDINTIKCYHLYHRFRNGYKTVSGKITISKLTTKKIWKIKCIKHCQENKKFFFILGLIKVDITKAYKGILSYNGYGFDARNATLKHKKINVLSYLDVPNEGDTISMVYQRVDNKQDDDDQMIRGELLFGINDGKLIRATAQIPISNGEKYRMAVSFWGKDTIKLLQ